MEIIGKLVFNPSIIEAFKNGQNEYVEENGAVVNAEKFSYLGKLLRLNKIPDNSSKIYKYFYDRILLIPEWFDRVIETECYFYLEKFKENRIFYYLHFKNGERYRLVYYRNRFMFVGTNVNSSLPKLYTENTIQDAIDTFIRNGNKVIYSDNSRANA